MELSAVMGRILGCLVEKAATTPDNYPLSTNALLQACNQSSNRDPVMNLDERTVDATMLELRMAGLARTVTGGRTNKHRHVVDEAWGLDGGELALMAVLFLRGPQTLNELKTRTERLHDFADVGVVERTLVGLAGRSDPFVELLERQVGQKERRWTELLGDAEEFQPDPALAAIIPSESDDKTPQPDTNADRVVRAEGSGTPDDEVRLLRAEVQRLRLDVDRLYSLLGEAPGPT
jgi:uncharacterized protein YceH (UPF0502 family)